MTRRHLAFILLFAWTTAESINYCSEVIPHFPGYSCKYEEPDRISKQGSKIFLISDDHKNLRSLKVLPLGPLAFHEVNLLKKFQKDPLIVNLLQVKIENKRLMMILESGDQMSLENLVLNVSAFKDQAYFYRIARALIHAVLHLKSLKVSLLRLDPRDILVSKDDSITFTNLEFAHLYEEQTRILGGTELLPPELVDDYKFHKAYIHSDLHEVYSLGLLFYYMKYKEYPYPEIQSSTNSLLNQFITFPAQEEMGFISLIQSTLVIKSKRINLDDLKESFIKQMLYKNSEVTRQLIKYQMNDGRLIYFEKENEKQKIIVISIGLFVFLIFLISFVFIKCRKCIKTFDVFADVKRHMPMIVFKKLVSLLSDCFCV